MVEMKVDKTGSVEKVLGGLPLQWKPPSFEVIIDNVKAVVSSNVQNSFMGEYDVSLSVFAQGYGSFLERVRDELDEATHCPKVMNILGGNCIGDVNLSLLDPSKCEECEEPEFIFRGPYQQGIELSPLGFSVVTEAGLSDFLISVETLLKSPRGFYQLTRFDGAFFLDFGSTSYFYTSIFAAAVCSIPLGELYEDLMNEAFVQKIRFKGGVCSFAEVDEIYQTALMLSNEVTEKAN